MAGSFQMFCNVILGGYQGKKLQVGADSRIYLQLPGTLNVGLNHVVAKSRLYLVYPLLPGMTTEALQQFQKPPLLA